MTTGASALREEQKCYRREPVEFCVVEGLNSPLRRSHKNTRPACKPSKPAGRCSAPLGRSIPSPPRPERACKRADWTIAPAAASRGAIPGHVCPVRDGTIAQPSRTSGHVSRAGATPIAHHFRFHALARASGKARADFSSSSRAGTSDRLPEMPALRRTRTFCWQGYGSDLTVAGPWSGTAARSRMRTCSVSRQRNRVDSPAA